MTRTRLAALVAAAAASGLAVASQGARSGAHAPHAPVASASEGVPAPVPPAFTPGGPVTLPAGRFVARWAPVRRAVLARRRPAARASVVARVPARTPEGTVNIVAVHESRTTRGTLWVRVGMATLPNGRTGWVRRSTLGGYATVDTHLVVDLERYTAMLYRRGHRIFRARVGVGRRGSPTPKGRFFVRDRLTRFADRFYGPVAFGTNARSPGLTDWPGGGFIGIHGTDRPALIPGRISHGCIRMRNADILALARRMPVGTPVTIR
jgi:lipoprotein-anchoring transpeptidase ErfK/SrfK